MSARPIHLCLSALAVSLAGCAAPRAVAPRADAGLIVAVRCAQAGECNLPDARVYVDDHFIGRAADLGEQPMAVRSGSRRVEVRADGWFTAYREVGVVKAGQARVEVPLRKVPDGESE